MIIYTVTFTLKTGTKVKKQIADHEVNWDGYPNTSPGIAMISTVEDLLLAEGIDVRNADGFVWDQEMTTTGKKFIRFILVGIYKIIRVHSLHLDKTVYIMR